MSAILHEAPFAFDRLSVRYGRTVAVSDLTLAVEPGAVYALLGRNGAGKTSALRCLLGEQRATSGRALLFAADAWHGRAAAMTRIGVVPEDPDAPPEMTSAELAVFCSRIYPRWDAGGVSRRLAAFAVPLRTPFGRLSKGQKAQTLLALALGHGPEALILDDPTLGLDVVARAGFLEELVGELADRGTTVLITSHDLAGVERIATRVGILKQGRLVVDEDLEALKARYRKLRYARREGGPPGAELGELAAVGVSVREWGIEAVVGNYSEAALAKLRAAAEVVDAEATPLTLEEIFTAVVGEDGGRS